ncbi:MAG: ferritin family protein [Candidatus Methanofastidiosa archaeon]|nr:ferritin family protein [Candidatus Methanofastidiosa archaeon]
MAYSVKDILNIALRSEEEAELYYMRLKDKTDNAFFREKLDKLSSDEKGHKALVLSLMREKGVGVEISVEKAVSIEMPSLIFDSSQPLSVLIRAAMGAEVAARKFYTSLSEIVEGERERSLLKYLASMEASHFHLLEAELTAIEHFEDYDDFFEMMHVGP